MPQRALITGITGQDGSYLAEQLLDDGWEVHGLIRRSSSFNTARLDHIYQDPHERGARLFLHHGDLLDASALGRLLHELRPDHIYNLGAQSHVRVSFDAPEFTADTVFMGALRLLEAVRAAGLARTVRFYQASSSEMFGSEGAPQSETTPFHPRSPYSAAKAGAHHLVVNYRESYGIHASCGILFNHESPRRGETFVTRKITRAAGRIAAGLQDAIHLGNLDAQRDWGYAPEYTAMMRLMLDQETPDDYVVATGETHSVREFLETAFAAAGLDPEKHARHDPRYERPAEVDLLLGDAAKAKEKLGWEPKVRFVELVRIMTEADMRLARREAAEKEARAAIGHDEARAD